MDLNRTMYCVDCGDFISDATLAAHLAAFPNHALVRLHHNATGTVTRKLMPMPPLGGQVYVDGSRALETYTPDGTLALPHKTIQAGCDVCPVNGLVKIAKWTYNENVVIPANINIDADVGTLLRSVAGDTLTLNDLGPAPASTTPVFIRGLDIEAEDPLGWAMHVVGTGAWGPNQSPFTVLLDQVVHSENKANGIWVEGGGVYLTDAGGMSGSSAIAVRVGNPASAIGGQVITGRYNLDCAWDGILFDVHENGYVDASEASCSTGDSGGLPSTAILAKLNGHDTPGTAVVFSARALTTNSDWGNLVVSTGKNVNVRIENHYGEDWGQCQGDVFNMLEGGNLTIKDGGYSSQDGYVFRFGQNGVTPSQGQIQLKDVYAVRRAGSGPVALIEGLIGNSYLYDCRLESNSPDPAASGVLRFNPQQNSFMAIVDGSYTGKGPVIDLFNPVPGTPGGSLFLLGGVDIIPMGIGLPGSIPIATALLTNLYRGHANIRSGVSLISGSETLLNSTFGTIEFGSMITQAKQGAGPALPGGGQGYNRGSLFVLIPHPAGTPIVQINIGNAVAPVWVPIAGGAALIRERAQLENCGSIDIDGGTYAAPVWLPFASGSHDNPPFTNHGSGIIEVQQAGIYQLSFSLPFEAANSFLVGCSPGACWYWSLDGGATWSPLVQTRTCDTVHGDADDNGALTLPPVEQNLAAGTRLRVGGFRLGTAAGLGCWVNGYGPEGGVFNESWARIERGQISYDYAPGNPAHWAAPPPTTEAAALDRLAAALSTHLGVPIP